MKIKVILPVSEEGKEKLSRAICKAHLDMVVKNINELNISYELKLKLFDAVCEEIQSRNK